MQWKEEEKGLPQNEYTEIQGWNKSGPCLWAAHNLVKTTDTPTDTMQKSNYDEMIIANSYCALAMWLALSALFIYNISVKKVLLLLPNL